jgi:hypothetical protein
MPGTPLRALSDDQIAFVEGARSIMVAATGRAALPAMARALGCRVAPDRRSVLLALQALQAADLFAALAAGGPIAVAFSDPQTHQALQLKGEDGVAIEVLAAELDALADHHLTLFRDSVEPLGFSPALVGAVMQAPPGTLRALRFTPTAIFEQTPGPQAGMRLP